MFNSMLFVLIIYFFILIFIGLITSYKKNHDSFTSGDNNLNFFVAAISVNVSDMGAWLFLGLPSAIYTTGLTKLWTPLTLITFMFLNWHIVAPKIKKAAQKKNIKTMLGFLEYSCLNKNIRIIGAMWCFLFLIVYISVGIYGIGIICESLFNIDYKLGCFLGISTTFIYISLGGFLAVAWSNCLQGIFLLIVIFIVPFFFTLKNHFIFPNFFFHTNNIFNIPIIEIIIIIFIWGLGYFGQPHILNKFTAIKNINDLKKAKTVSLIWQLIVLFASSSIGMIALWSLSNITDTKTIFAIMVSNIFIPFVSAIIMCAVLSAIISTLDAQILSLSSILTDDIYKRFLMNYFKIKMIIISRITIFFIAFIAFIISIYPMESIYNTVECCWIGLGGVFAPVILLVKEKEIINIKSIILGMFINGLTTIYIYVFNENPYFLFNNFLITNKIFLLISFCLYLLIITFSTKKLT